MLPGAEELAPGLHRWTAFHEEWKQEVASVAVDAGERLVLIDPLAPPGLRDARAFWKALDGEAITAPESTWSSRCTTTAAAPRPSSSATGSVPAQRSGRRMEASAGSMQRLTTLSHPATRSPAASRRTPVDTTTRSSSGYPRQQALVSGDVLLGGTRKPYRVCPQSWLPKGVHRADVAAALAPLLDLPVSLLVPTHGPPVTDGAAEALEAALAEAHGQCGPDIRPLRVGDFVGRHMSAPPSLTVRSRRGRGPAPPASYPSKTSCTRRWKSASNCSLCTITRPCGTAPDARPFCTDSTSARSSSAT